MSNIEDLGSLKVPEPSHITLTRKTCKQMRELAIPISIERQYPSQSDTILWRPDRFAELKKLDHNLYLADIEWMKP